MTLGAPTDDDTSDYGDLEDPEELEIIDRLLAQTTSEVPLIVTDIEDYETPRGVRVLKASGGEFIPTASTQSHIDAEVLRDFQPPSVEVRKPRQRQDSEETSTEPDDRPPLVRFRRPPKKALSVTDLVSPAWCELQYFYTLSKHGRKRRTPAMKQGTAVHQALEEEIHVTVPVEVTTAEDSWALRIWNIVQGLRSLRSTGRTRELEVWGTVGGELVNGVIDEVSYECPDPRYEENLRTKKKKTKQETAEAELQGNQTNITDYLLADGARARGEDGKAIGEVLTPATATATETATRAATTEEDEKWIYITDVKTRATPTLPTGSSLRPTILQLHLYYYMLDSLARGHFQLSTLTERYGLDPHATFSDSFLAQLGRLDGDGGDGHDLSEATGASSLQGEQISVAQTMSSSQNALDVLLQHNDLASLWSYMMNEFHLTFSVLSPPAPASVSASVSASTPTLKSTTEPAFNQLNPLSLSSSSSPPPPPPPPTTTTTRLSPLLTAKYLAPTYRHASTVIVEEEQGNKKNNDNDNNRQQRSSIIGHKSFGFNPTFLQSYLTDSLAWWRGERDPRGVGLTEAWKCRLCDFRDGCRWIKDRDRGRP